MESSTQFNLEKDIKTWRSDLKGQGSLDSNDLDELENHLRESIEHLAIGTLSMEEAYIVAKRRMGEPADLRVEFQKVNPGRLWSTRVCWMLVGYLSFTLIGTFAALFSKLTALVSVFAGIQSGIANFSGILILVATWTLFVHFLRKRCQSNGGVQPFPFLDFFTRHPTASALITTMVYLTTYVLGQATTNYFAQNLPGSRGEEISNYLLTQLFSTLGVTCLLLAGATLAIHGLRRLSS
jgi:hypothetical protein